MRKLLVLLTLTVLSAVLPAAAESTSDNLAPPYDRLQLSPDQADKIKQLEGGWNSRYQQVQPRVLTLQHRLESLLSSPQADSIEITSLQQRINQLREQLGVEATSTYLRKRNVLNDGQRAQLDNWMRRQFSSRIHGEM